MRSDLREPCLLPPPPPQGGGVLAHSDGPAQKGTLSHRKIYAEWVAGRVTGRRLPVF